MSWLAWLWSWPALAANVAGAVVWVLAVERRERQRERSPR